MLFEVSKHYIINNSRLMQMMEVYHVIQSRFSAVSRPHFGCYSSNNHRRGIHCTDASFALFRIHRLHNSWYPCWSCGMIDWQKLRTVMGRLLFITVFNPDRDTFVEMRNPYGRAVASSARHICRGTLSHTSRVQNDFLKIWVGPR